ncbi:MAG: Ppx/GppA phosphatase family protein [Pseudomonadota bacterium]
MTEDAREGASPRAAKSGLKGVSEDRATAAQSARRSGTEDAGGGPRRPKNTARTRRNKPGASGPDAAQAARGSNVTRDGGRAHGKAHPNSRGSEAGANRSSGNDGTGRADGRGRRRRGGGPSIAALDLGTNNCRLLVARADADGFFVIDAFSRVVRLGEGLAETGRLSQGAMDRALSALSVCADRLRKHRVQRFRAIATEACRRAENHREFLDRVRDETGLYLDIIQPEEEARLAVAGCAPLFDTRAEHLLVFDIGGGSTELIWVDLAKTTPQRRKSLLMALAHGASRSDRARAAAQHIADWVSLPVGVVTLQEKYNHIADDTEKFEAMQKHVADLIVPFAKNHCEPTAERLSRMQLLGTSGTITTLAGVHLDLERYSRRAVDGLWIASSAVDRVIERLVGMNGEQRAAIPCIGEDRSTNLMSGAAILRAILRAWPTERVRVADRGLREGMLYGLIQDAAERRQRRGRPSSR